MLADHRPALGQSPPSQSAPGEQTSTSSSTSTSSAPSTSTSTSTTSTSAPAPPPSLPPDTVPPPAPTPSPVDREPSVGPPPPSISDDAVASFLASFPRTPANSSLALVDALRTLQALGLTLDEALMAGMGRFPVAGEAFFRDDFGDYRAGPPVHAHQGNDIWAAFDTPVRSPADGVVQYAEEAVGGKAAYVTEPDGTWYYLAHLSRFAPGVRSGGVVHQGQLIGFNGDTGNARGGPPHVHFEIHPRGGAAVNPKPFLDRWLADALAAVPALLAPYRQIGIRPLAAVGLARHFDHGLLAGPPAAPEDPTADAAAARMVADALVGPLTPRVLREVDALALSRT